MKNAENQSKWTSGGGDFWSSEGKYCEGAVYQYVYVKLPKIVLIIRKFSVLNCHISYKYENKIYDVDKRIKGLAPFSKRLSNELEWQI